MALMLKRLFQSYYWLFNDLADPRVEGLFLMSSPFEPAIIVGLYLYFVFNLGPKFMRDRKPYDLKNAIKAFNLFQLIINGYIVYHGFKELFNLNWKCAPIDYAPTPHNLFITKVTYVYYITKITDLLDTIFFVLRKRERQISFLHVYHHSGMIGVAWIGVKFLAGGHSIFMGFLNSFVHTLMYFYYLLTVWDEKYKKSLWWKRYITQMQLLQFLLLVIIYGILLFQPNCKYPKIASYFFVPQNIFMLFLFGDFYWKNYVIPEKKKQQS